MSIRTKSILGFGLGLAFLVVECLVALATLDRSGRQATELYEKSQHALEAGRAAAIDFRDLAAARHLAIHLDAPLVGQAQGEYQRAHQALDGHLRDAQRLAGSPSVVERLELVGRQLEVWDHVVPPDLISVRDEVAVQALCRDLRAALDRVATDIGGDALAAAGKARDGAAEAWWILFAVSLALVLASTGLAMALVRGVIGPLGTALARAEEARTGAESDRHVQHVRAEMALEKVRTLQAQLVETERLASLGGMVAGVAHEVNTPLGSALGASGYLLHRTRTAKGLFEAEKLKKSDAEAYFKTAEESAVIINANLDRAAELIHSFKQVAVDETSNLCRRFDLATYIGDIVVSLKPRLKKLPHRVTVDCPEKLELDQFAGGLAQILTNLIMNALVHAFEGVAAGTIAITARARDDKTVELVVADDGCGIPPEIIGSIFVPFFTTRRSRGGSGLGLHIVHTIVTQRLGGTITVDSTVGTGTRFVLVFPRRVQATAGDTGHV